MREVLLQLLVHDLTCRPLNFGNKKPSIKKAYRFAQFYDAEVTVKNVACASDALLLLNVNVMKL